MTPDDKRLAARPEARWALWSGVFGALAATALSVKEIFSSTSSSAGLAFFFVPLVAAAVAIPAGVWGAALGHVVLVLRGSVRSPRPVFISALLAAAAPPAVLGYEIWRGLA
jgi:hypothetical protein